MCQSKYFMGECELKLQILCILRCCTPTTWLPTPRMKGRFNFTFNWLGWQVYFKKKHTKLVQLAQIQKQWFHDILCQLFKLEFQLTFKKAHRTCLQIGVNDYLLLGRLIRWNLICLVIYMFEETYRERRFRRARWLEKRRNRIITIRVNIFQNWTF